MVTDPRVDQYITNAAEFARPILRHFRDLVHTGCPEVEETIKWGRPIFLYRKKILFGMAAFKGHCGFAFWQPDVAKMIASDGINSDEGSGSLGRISQMSDLPSGADLLRYIHESRRRFDEGVLPGKSPRPRSYGSKAQVVAPDDFVAALGRNKAAAKTFESFSRSHQREYLEWITEAKREETRQKRIATALEWLQEGKARNWKYANG